MPPLAFFNKAPIEMIISNLHTILLHLKGIWRLLHDGKIYLLYLWTYLRSKKG